ncbi:MAG TPA: chromate resistance protein ChrB domain-containing protein [Gemmatimonadales bacterium]|nr:chromate resistance protein ChrB domain-containing protein [Gemmatimonadales bacterium]
MHDTTESNPQEDDRREWLLLIHQLPPEPAYLRVKVRRRLQRLGAVALKNSVYVLPRQDDTLEDFQWLLREIQAEGGAATLCGATLLDGTSDREVEALFRAGCDAAYAELERLIRDGELDPVRLRHRLEEVKRVDFFDAAGRLRAERALAAAEQGTSGADTAGGPDRVRGATWVTRAGAKVDRMASAWLIRRFIDPEARFRFTPGGSDPAAPGELRFDMFEGEYTHEGDRCTFEVLLERFRLRDPALDAIAEIVHDIDCKDEKFGRAETPGIAAIVAGLVLAHPGDTERLAQGATIFDGLYARLGEGAVPA